jgi:hypothetical protein
MACLAAMMFLIAVDVILRKLLDKPVTGSYELIQFMMVVTVALAVAYTDIEKSHVTLDLVTPHFPKRARAIIDSIVAYLVQYRCHDDRQACLYILTIKRLRWFPLFCWFPYPWPSWLWFAFLPWSGCPFSGIYLYGCKDEPDRVVIAGIILFFILISWTCLWGWLSSLSVSSAMLWFLIWAGLWGSSERCPLPPSRIMVSAWCLSSC